MAILLSIAQCPERSSPQQATDGLREVDLVIVLDNDFIFDQTAKTVVKLRWTNTPLEFLD